MALAEEKPTNAYVDLETGRGTVAVALRRHPRARNYTLRVGVAAEKPVLTMPVYGSLHEARAFLHRHTGWLLKQIDSRPEPRPIVEGGLIPLRGVEHRIVHGGSRRGTTMESRLDDQPVLIVFGRAEHLRRRVLDHLKREARRDLERAAMRHAVTLGVRIKSIRLRDQTSRWGSCSSQGNLSFSWRLIMAPPMVLDYLAAHEAAHLHEMNHGPRFWHLVESICPHTSEARAWLNREGPALHSIGT